MTLQFVKPSTDTKYGKILLYGPPGAGKTNGAASAPGPILYLNAEGADALDFSREMFGNDKIREVAFTGKQSMVDTYLHAKEGKEKTFVVDTIGEMYRMLLEEIGGERPTLQNYGDVNTMIERFVRSLRDLPMHVVIVCHEEIADQEGELVRRPVTGGKKLPEILMAMMSTVAYCAVVPRQEDGTPARYMAQLVQAKGRRAKDRGGKLGESRPLDLNEWIQIMRSSSATKEKAA